MKLHKILFSYITNPTFRAGIKKLTISDVENISALSDIEQAKTEADRLHVITGYKYYVINWSNNTYKVVNMQWVNRMKRLKLLPKDYDWLRLEKYSVYVTH